MTNLTQLSNNEIPQSPANPPYDAEFTALQNPPYDEELAVLLEEENETAWRTLLQEVSPQFGDPIAAQVAHIMKSRMTGKYVGKLIRKMLTDKAIADRIDDSDDSVVRRLEPEYSEEDSEDEYSEDEEPTTALILASERGETDIVKMLLKDGATNVNQHNDDGETAIDVAIEKGHTEIVGLLLDNGVDVNGKNYIPPLLSACGKGNTEMVKLLLDKGADINITDDEEMSTPLMWAIISKQTEIVGLLLDRGADLNTYDDNGDTALDWAENRKEKEIVEILKNKGARTSSDIWYEGEQKRCLSMLDQKTLDKLNKMSDEERKEAMHWLTEEFLMTGPLEPLEPVYVPPKDRLGIK